MNTKIPDSTTVPGVVPSGASRAGLFESGDRVAGRYTIESVLAAGGMGIVYRARQDLTNREVALKVIRPVFASGPLVDRFLEEIQMLGRLNHPNIARIHDADLHHAEDGASILFFTMDLVAGVPATEFCRQNTLSRDQILELAIQLCEALQYAHDHGVIHCDLKPANVLVRSDGSPVVIDFGLARLVQMSRSVLPADAVLSESARLPAGTPKYMSPEQFQGGVLELRAGQSIDVYGLGVLTFALLSGRPPYDFSAGSFEDIRRCVLFENPRHLSEFIDGCEPEMDRTIAKALRKDPADRYFSVASFQRALQRLLPRESSSLEPAWKPSPGKQIPSTRWVLDEKLGEGGVGEVWLSHHRDLGEKRIVKFCANEEKAALLRRELTLYRLLKEKIGRHEHFVPLEEVSLDEPPYYLMAHFIDARDLGRWFRENGGHAAISEAVRLEIVAQAADALQAAHEVGVLHRDVKASNLLVRANPQQPESVHVWVSDFGLGQVISEELLAAHASGFTRTVFDSKMTGSGTQLYMAPELTAGGDATVRSDIYSLGVVLFHILIGDFRQPITIDWRKMIADPLLCDDLERCLAGDPSERFAGAGQLAVHLRTLGQRREQQSREKAALAAREKAAHRRGVLRATGVLGTAVALLVAFAVSMWRLYRETWHSNARSVLNELKATRLSEAPYRSQKILESFDKIGGDYPDDLRAEFRQELVSALAMASLPSESTARVHNPAETLVGHSDCWQQLATMDGSGRLKIYAAENDASLPSRTLGESLPPIRHVAISEDGSLAVALEGPNVLVWDAVASGGTQPVRLAGDTDVLLASCHTNGLIALAHPSGGIDLRGRVDGYQSPLTLDRSPPKAELEGGFIFPQAGASPPFLRPASALAFSRDGRFLAAGSLESLNVLIWDTATGELVEAAPHNHGVHSVAWNPNTLEFATGCENGRISLWRLDPERPFGKRTTCIEALVEARHFEHPVSALSYDPSGRKLLAVSAIGQRLLIQAGTLRVIERNEAPDKEMRQAGLGTDGSLLFQNSEGRLCLVGAPHAGVFASTQLEMSIPVEEMSQAVFDSVIAVTTRCSLSMVDLRSGRVLGQRPIPLANGVVLDPLARDLWVNGSEVLRWWKTPPQSETLVYPGSTWIGKVEGEEIGGGGGELDVVRVSPDACLIVTSRGDRLKVYRRSEDRLEKLLDTTSTDQPEDSITSVALDPRGLWVAALRDGAARAEVWDLKTQRRIEVGMPDGGCRALVWAPSGDFLALRNDREIAFARTGSWNPHGRLNVPGPSTGRPVIAWSSDGHLLATTAAAGDVELFDVAKTVEPINPLPLCALQPPQSITICALRFCGEAGRFLTAGTTDGHVQLWDLHRLRHELSRRSLDWAKTKPPDLKPLATIKRVEFPSSRK